MKALVISLVLCNVFVTRSVSMILQNANEYQVRKDIKKIALRANLCSPVDILSKQFTEDTVPLFVCIAYANNERKTIFCYY